MSVATERRYLDDEPLPAPQLLLARAARENFPVASRFLPSRQRHDLLAIYGFARLVDYAGDELPGDRLAALDWIEAELDRALTTQPAPSGQDPQAGQDSQAGRDLQAGPAGPPVYPLIARAAATIQARRLDDDLLRRLIEANREDQRVRRYPTFEALLGYCELSANPIGRLVLGIFDASTPEREHQSDLVCTGLQLAEHWQDVAEDAAAGRVYLPMEDLDRFGVSPDELTGHSSSDALRGLLAFEVARTRGLLDEGTPLIRSMPARARLAVAGFVAGGQAALDGVVSAGFDVLATPPRLRRRHLVRLVRRMIPSLTQRPRHGRA